MKTKSPRFKIIRYGIFKQKKYQKIFENFESYTDIFLIARKLEKINLKLNFKSEYRFVKFKIKKQRNYGIVTNYSVFPESPPKKNKKNVVSNFDYDSLSKASGSFEIYDSLPKASGSFEIIDYVGSDAHRRPLLSYLLDFIC